MEALLRPILMWKDKLRFFVRKSHKRMRKTSSHGWGGLSLLVFFEDSHDEPKQFRINYFILIFLVAIIILPLLFSLAVHFNNYLSTEKQSQRLETRYSLLETSMALTIEKKQLIDRAQRQLRRFHRKFSPHKTKSMREILNEDPSSLTMYKPEHIPSKPGLYRSRYELDLLVPLRRDVESLVLRQSPYIFRPIWNRILIHHLMPRGWGLAGGVGYVTSLYGNRRNPIGSGSEFHSGVDFAYVSGTPIIATAPGIIIRALRTPKSGYGKFVRIHHGFGYTSLYAHCQSLAVKEGDYVKRGQVIAYVGRTGRVTGEHLHYEIQLGLDQAINPLPYIKLK